MAAGGPQHAGFTNDEKNFLLAELIKSAAPPYNLLLDVFNRLHTQPRLEDIPLPPGRSLNACRLALDEMRRGPMYSPLSSAGAVSTPLSAPMPPLKRLSGIDAPYSTGRALLPKTSGFAYSPTISEAPLKRKRGRPTKAEQQARAAEAASTSGEPSTMAHPRFSTPLSASIPASPIVEPRPSSTSLPATRVPISAMITTTPTATKSASHSGSSSGKKRRRRRSEEQITNREAGVQPSSSSQQQPLHQHQQTQLPYASTYARMPELDETPARSAASRRREEPVYSTGPRLGVSEPEQTSGAQSGRTSGSPQPRGPQLPPLPRQGR